jgi:uncharacterized membrane protein YdjX (TVP38/TMEM64 family)
LSRWSGRGNADTLLEQARATGTRCDLYVCVPRTSRSPRTLPSTRAALIRIGVLVFISVVAGLIAYNRGWFDVQHTLEHFARLRRSYNLVGFSIAFVVVIAIGTAAGGPAMPFVVTAGALFGTLFGSIISWGGAMLGAAAGYWLARTIGHGVVVNWLRRFRRASGAADAARDFHGMLRLRFIAILPLGIVSFIGGLARTPFVAYMAATAIGIIPSILIYCYFADSLIEGVSRGKSDAIVSLVIASALLIALSLAPRWLARTSE